MNMVRMMQRGIPYLPLCLALFAGTGCQMTHNITARLVYPPPDMTPNSKTATSNQIQHLRLVDCLDRRPDKANLGVTVEQLLPAIDNVFVFHPDSDVLVWFRKALEFELASAGYLTTNANQNGSTLGNLSLGLTQAKNYVDAKGAWWGEITFSAELRLDNGQTLVKQYEGKADGTTASLVTAPATFCGDALAKALHSALTKFLDDLSVLMEK